jgi:hypothetical protein
MNMEIWLLEVRRELSRMAGPLEAKIERHADLVLWTFSLIVALGLGLDQSSLSGRCLHLLGQLVFLALIAVLVPLPWLFVSSCRAARISRSQRRPQGSGLSIASFISVCQCGLICTSAGFLALFVLCVVHRNLQGGFECLAMAALPIVALWETLYVEERVARPVTANAGLVAWIGRLKFDVGAAVGSCGLACVLFYAFLRLSILPG